MDYDDSDFQNHQNLHLADNKFPPVSLPRFDFEDRFDSLVETEGFLGNEDSSWIEDFSRPSSSSGGGVVFSSAATESCLISRHINVWSEATSSESVAMLLNSVGQENQVIVKQKMDQLLEPDQTNHKDILSKEETTNVQPSVDVTPADSSVSNTDAGQEHNPVKDDSPTVAEEEEDNAILASNTAAVEDVDTACHDKIGTETTDNLLDQTVAEELSIEEKNADVASNSAIVVDVNSTEHDKVGTGTTYSLLTIVEKSSMEENNSVIKTDAGQEQFPVKDAEESSMEEDNAILASNTAAVEDVVTACHDKMGTETTDSLLDQTVAEELSVEEENADVASNSAIVVDVSSTEPDKIGTETTDSLLTIAEESSKKENDTVLASVTMTREAVDTASQDKIGIDLALNTATVEDVSSAGHDKIGTETTANLLDQTDEANTESRIEIDCSDGTETTGNYLDQTVAEEAYLEEKNTGLAGVNSAGHVTIGTEISDSVHDQTVAEDASMEDKSVVLASDTTTVEPVYTGSHGKIRTETTDRVLDQAEDEENKESMMEIDCRDGTAQSESPASGELNNQTTLLAEIFNEENDISDYTAKSNLKDMEPSDVTVLERGDLSALEEGEPDVSGAQCEDIPVSIAHTSATVEPSLELAGVLTNLTSSEHTSTFQTETHTETLRVETSESVNVSQMDSMVESAEGGVSKKSDNKEGSVCISNLKQSMELAVSANDRDQDAKCSEVLSESVVSESVGYVSREHASKLVDSKSQSDIIPIDKSAGADCREEDKTAASGGIMTSATPVSYPKGVVIEVGESCGSTSSEPFVKSLIGTENAVTNLGTPVISSPALKTTELQPNKTETNSVKKPEDQNTSSLMSTESPFLYRKATVSSGLNLTSDPRKAVELSKATLVSPIVVGSPSKSSLEKTAAKSSKAKSERKPRRTPKSVGKETSRKGNSVKGATPVQHFQSAGKAIAAIHSSIEKQESLQNPVLNSFSTISAPTASLPDVNSSALSRILPRPFTDSQQVQLRAQIFVYGGLIQGTAPDEAYMISAFGGADGGRGSWEKAWRACAERAQRMRISSPETPLQSRAGKTETPSMSSATKPIIPLSSPLWSLSTPFETLQSRSIQSGSAAAPLPSSSHAHQAAPVTNIGHNTAWMSPLPYPNPWLASPQTSGFDVGSRFPVFPITESVKLTPTKESSLPNSGGKHVLSGTSGNVFKGTQTLEPASTIGAPAQHSTGTKSRKRKKMPVSVESDPSILNSLQQTEIVVSPIVSLSTHVPITAAPVSLASNAGTLPSVDSISAVPMNLVSTFTGKKTKSSLQSPIFGGNLVSEVERRSVLPVDTIDKLSEAKLHAEDASALATAAVSHSKYVWKQIEQQRHAGLQPETQGRLASAAVSIAAAAAVAKAAAAAANVAANAALLAKLMAEEASLQSVSYQVNDVITQGQGTPASVLKGEGATVSSSPLLSAAREAAKKRVEAATAATKLAENMDSIVKAAELASEAVSQAGILVSMGHPPSLNKLVEVGQSNYWRQPQKSEEAQPCKVGVLEKETVTISDRAFASPSTAHAELDSSVRTADVLSGLVSATGKKATGQKGHKNADLAKHTAVVYESKQIMKTTTDECIKEGSHVEVFKEGSGSELRTAWYSANVLSLEDGKAYVLFNDLSVEQGTDKLKEWVALKGEGDEAPKIRTARSVTAMPYEGTRKRRRAAIGDHVWKIGDRVDSWVHDSWLEGVILEKNKKDENTVTVHFPAQGETLTIKAWNLRPSLVWKDGRWIECCTSGENISSSHEGDTPKEKRPRLAAPAPVAEGKDTKMETVDDPDLGKPSQTGVLDLGVAETTFNIGTSTKEEGKPGPFRMKRTGLQTQGEKVIYGVPKPGKKRKFMDVSKHYVSEASNKTGKQKEPFKPVPQYPGPGSWRLPSKPREKQTTTSKPKTFKPASKTKDKPAAASRIIPRKDSRNTTAADMESENAVGQSEENKDPTTGTTSSSQGQESSSSSTTGKGKVAPAAGRLAKIDEGKTLAEASDGMEPRRSVRRIQPTSRLLEGLQSSMLTSKIPSMSHSRSHQSQSNRIGK